MAAEHAELGEGPADDMRAREALLEGVLRRCRTTLITALQDTEADLSRSARRVALQRRIREIAEVLGDDPRAVAAREQVIREQLLEDGFDVAPYRGADRVQWGFPIVGVDSTDASPALQERK